MDGPSEGEVLLKEEFPTPVGLVMFEPLGPDRLPLLRNRDGLMTVVRVKESLTVLATCAKEELELATTELALATPVSLLIGGK